MVIRLNTTTPEMMLECENSQCNTIEYAENLINRSEECASWIDERTGKCVAVVGIIRSTPHRVEVWSILGKPSGKFMLPITRFLKQRMASLVFERLETYVVKDFGMGHKWMNILGFEAEGILRSLFPGIDFVAYSIIRKEKGR